MQITLFENARGIVATACNVAWADIYAQACQPHRYATKNDLPLIKLARFGDQRSDKGALRHDANVIGVTGIEGDYDGETMHPGTAADLLTLAGIYALIYTSPSHQADKPRWRVLAPLSREYAPDARRELVGRINAALGGILANESFTLSQTYYWGAVAGVDYVCLHTHGSYVDQVAIAPVYPVNGSTVPGELVDDPGEVTEEVIRDLRAALAMMPADDRNEWIAMGQALCKLGQIGYQLWQEWSAKSTKYDPNDMWRWSSFTGDRTDHRAVFSAAARYGWINPKSRKPIDLSGVKFGAFEGTAGEIRRMPLNQALDPFQFPHQNARNKKLASIENLKWIFEHYGVKCYYDEILKEQVITFDGHQTVINDLSANGQLQQIKSLCAINEVPLETTERLTKLLEENSINPVVQFITGKPWDGTSRLNDFYETVLVSPEDIPYRNKAILMWLIQCVAAADGAKQSPRRDKIEKFEAALVFQGKQGRLKTTWILSLVPREYREYVKGSVTLDLSNKDSHKHAISGWICELGELDSTFRKSDISRLKAFLSMQTDEIRLPYDRAPSKFQRRTSFTATVNEPAFLVDDTGNRRFIPLPVHGTNPYHGIDMQQLWAEVWDLYIGGAQWWPDAELNSMLPDRHAQHSQLDHIEDAIRSKFDLSTIATGGKLYSCTEILTECGWGHSNKADINAVARVLRNHGIHVVKTAKKRGYFLALQSPFEN